MAQICVQQIQAVQVDESPGSQDGDRCCLVFVFYVCFIFYIFKIVSRNGVIIAIDSVGLPFHSSNSASTWTI